MIFLNVPDAVNLFCQENSIQDDVARNFITDLYSRNLSRKKKSERKLCGNFTKNAYTRAWRPPLFYNDKFSCFFFFIYFFVLYFEVWDLSSVSSVVYENFLKKTSRPSRKKKVIMNNNPPIYTATSHNNTNFVFLILYFI